MDRRRHKKERRGHHITIKSPGVKDIWPVKSEQPIGTRIGHGSAFISYCLCATYKYTSLSQRTAEYIFLLASVFSKSILTFLWPDTNEKYFTKNNTYRTPSLCIS
jgi:hypothetical protein